MVSGCWLRNYALWHIEIQPLELPDYFAYWIILDGYRWMLRWTNCLLYVWYCLCFYVWYCLAICDVVLYFIMRLATVICGLVVFHDVVYYYLAVFDAILYKLYLQIIRYSSAFADFLLFIGICRFPAIMQNLQFCYLAVFLVFAVLQHFQSLLPCSISICICTFSATLQYIFLFCCWSTKHQTIMSYLIVSLWSFS